jgi:Tfp pilus assembly protein PilX
MSRQQRSSPSDRRGSAYLIVLAAAMIVATLGLGALLAVRSQNRAARALMDAAEARQNAHSAIELGRLWISQDPKWRSNRPNGAWATNQPMGAGSYSLEVTDPLDGDLANRPHDPVVLKAIGVKGQARHIAQVTLTASPEPLPALRCAAHTGGQLHVKAGKLFIAASSVFSTNGSLRNDGTIRANVEAASAQSVGTVTGTLTLGVPPKSLPDASVAEMYARLGTTIVPPSTIDKQVLAPGRNPWGAGNSDGVYVIRTNNNVTIRNSRVYGTLVVICPNNTVTVDSNVLIHSYRADYPALIVDGNAVFQYDSNTRLSETTLATNFNPAGAPFEGSEDADMADVYPSELRGLVHVTGTVRLTNTAMVRGCLLCCPANTTDALVCDGTNEIVYNSALSTNPPQGYTSAVKMLVQPGSWRQMVE